MFKIISKLIGSKEASQADKKEESPVESFYHNDRERILAMVDEMGESVCKALENSLASLKERDNDLANRVVTEDDVIDFLETELNRECLSLIAMRNPVREELRFVFAVLKIATDLERIGDQAVNVSQRALAVSKYPVLKPLVDITLMTEIAVEMVQSSLTAFFQRDTDLAVKVFKKDKKLDKLANSLSEELIGIMGNTKKGNADKIRVATELFLTARHLERVGDHASNIAERVFFMVKGERLKEVVLGKKTSPGFSEESS